MNPVRPNASKSSRPKKRGWLDDVAQRQVAMAVFCCLGVFKAAGVLSLVLRKDESPLPFPFSLWVEWSLLDAVFFVGLRICQVPRLTFSLSLSFVLVLSLSLINGGILGGVSSVIKHPSLSLLSFLHFTPGHQVVAGWFRFLLQHLPLGVAHQPRGIQPRRK